MVLFRQGASYQYWCKEPVYPCTVIAAKWCIEIALLYFLVTWWYDYAIGR